MRAATKIALIALMLVILGLRLNIAFGEDNLNYEAYSVARQVEHIRETGTPILADELSFEGKTHVFSPLYHYFLAFFNLFLPLNVVLKLIPNILATLTILAVFHLAKLLTDKETIAVLAAGLSGITPIFFNNTINNASIYSAVIPLILLTIYYFMQTNKEASYYKKLLACLVVFALLHPSSVILVLGFLLYFALVKAQGFRESKREPEVLLFSLFLILWANMIIYKRALAIHGSTIVWQNIPQALLSASYSQITFLESIYSLGVIPLLFGLGSIYLSLFYSKNKTITMMMSVSTIVFLLLLFRFIELDKGLLLLGAFMSVLSAYSMNDLYESAATYKFRSSQLYFILIVIIVSVATFIPNMAVAREQASIGPSEKDIKAFEWMKANIPADAEVLTLPEEGSAMTFFSERRNVIDDDFVLVKNVDSRYSDLTNIYTERFVTSAMEKLNYYSIEYILLSEHNQKKSNRTTLLLGYTDCLLQDYPAADFEPRVYRVVCLAGR